jgi:hypothetical protein
MCDHDEVDPKKPRPAVPPKKESKATEAAEHSPWRLARKDFGRGRHHHHHV